MALQRISADAPIDDILALFESDGGLVVEGMFPTDVIATMRDAVVEAAGNFDAGAATQGVGEAGRMFAGGKTIRFSSLGRISPAFFEILDNPLYGAIADAMLLPACGSYWVNTGQAMLIGPGESAQMLHRDCLNWVQFCAPRWPDCPEITVSAMIALEEVTEDLGATRVIPGSHLWTDFTDFGDPSQTVPAELSPGDALVYSGKVVHGGGANVTNAGWRRAMHLSFVAGWLVPEESSPLDYTDEELSDLSPRVQRLLGHRSYDPSPHFGGGLWLRNVNRIEDDLSTPGTDDLSSSR